MKKIYLPVLAILGWFAVIVQFYLTLQNKNLPTAELIIQFFSYFTITTNLIVAVCCSSLSFLSVSSIGKWFAKQSTFTAITVYISIVGIIYNLVLRFTWNPQGLQRIVDELLHTIIPLFFLLYWLLFTKKNQLKWNSFFVWLIYPFVYVILIFTRGAVSGFYPYPFLSVPDIGFTSALINAGYVAIAFTLVSLLFIALGKRLSFQVNNIK